MAKKDPNRALAAFKAQHDDDPQITNIKLARGGHILVTTKTKISLPKTFHNVTVASVLQRQL